MRKIMRLSGPSGFQPWSTFILDQLSPLSPPYPKVVHDAEGGIQRKNVTVRRPRIDMLQDARTETLVDHERGWVTCGYILQHVPEYETFEYVAAGRTRDDSGAAMEGSVRVGIKGKLLKLLVTRGPNGKAG